MSGHDRVPVRASGASAPDWSVHASRTNRWWAGLARARAGGATSSFLVVAGVTCFVFFQLRPDLVFAPTMDVGGDNAAHVVAISYFIHHLLPHGQLTGWDPQWFGGFPLYAFYFPLPAVLAAFYHCFVSYAVAFKLVTITGSVLLPTAAFSFGRLAGFRRPVPALMSVAMLAYLFNTSYTIDGGNIMSTMAGEFSFSLSLSFALFFLGVFCYALRTGRLRWLAALLFAATVLSHVVPALFAAGTAVLVALGELHRSRRGPDVGGRLLEGRAGELGASRGRWPQRQLARLPAPLRTLVVVGLVGGLLSAFWLLPFGAELRYSASMGYARVTGFTSNFFPGPVDDVLVILAVLGVAIALLRRDRIALVLGVAGAGVVLAFVFLPDGLLYNARWLPFWFLVCDLLAAYALDEGARFALARRGLLDWVPAVPVTGLVVALGLASAYLGLLPLSTGAALDPAGAWTAFNYTGYQQKPGWPEFHALVGMLERVAKVHGCGRLTYEYSPNTSDAYGSTLAPMSFPLWTHGCIDVEAGVYYESSTWTYYHFLNESELSIAPPDPVAGLPYHGLDVADGIRHLQLSGVKYFLASSPTVEAAAAKDRSLVRVGSSPEQPSVVDRGPGAPVPAGPVSYVLYEVRHAPIVAPLTHVPIVEHLGKLAWRATTISWFQSPSSWPVEIAAGGPASWPVVHPGSLPQADSTPRLPATRVRDVHVGNERLSFDVSRLDTPVLVKVPYFPAWTVAGASGPYEGAPDFMIVVPHAHHVVLTYRATRVTWIGRAGTIAGLAGLGLLVEPGPATPLWSESDGEVAGGGGSASARDGDDGEPNGTDAIE